MWQSNFQRYVKRWKCVENKIGKGGNGWKCKQEGRVRVRKGRKGKNINKKREEQYVK